MGTVGGTALARSLPVLTGLKTLLLRGNDFNMRRFSDSALLALSHR